MAAPFCVSKKQAGTCFDFCSLPAASHCALFPTPCDRCHAGLFHCAKAVSPPRNVPSPPVECCDAPPLFPDSKNTPRRLRRPRNALHSPAFVVYNGKELQAAFNEFLILQEVSPDDL